VAFSFNGGKDCTVLLHLLRAATAEVFGAADMRDVLCIYFEQRDEFPEVLDFISAVCKRYGMQMRVLQGSFKEALHKLFVTEPVDAIVMGQRRGDPGAAQLDELAPSDPTWPRFVRVNAILSWSYAAVWDFLRSYGVEYCVLYDQGYTSLGCTRDTAPNPALLRGDGSFAPAYELRDEALERAGRTAKSVAAAAQRAAAPLACGKEAGAASDAAEPAAGDAPHPPAEAAPPPAPSAKI
jgi:FAD synthetase